MSQSLISRLAEIIKYYGIKGLIRLIFLLMRAVYKWLHLNKGLK
jgi:hypothetical protein